MPIDNQVFVGNKSLHQMAVAAGDDHVGLTFYFLRNQNDQAVAQSAEAVKDSAEDTGFGIASD